MRAVLFSLLFLCLLASCAQDETAGPGKLTWQIALLTPDPFPGAAVGVPYDIDLHYNVTGQAPYSWSVTAGTLPPGLALDPSDTRDSRLHGTPTAAGPWGFTITIHGKVGPVDFPVSVYVQPAGSLIITTNTLPMGTAGGAYGTNIFATGGSGTGYTWSIETGTLPAGLSIDARANTLNWGGFSSSGTATQSQISGMAASRSQPGAFWVHEEGAGFYAIDDGGNLLQEYTLGTSVIAIEDIGLGPGGFLYFADAGDPTGSRSDCRIYRVAEPVIPVAPGAVQTVPHDEFWFTYPAGSQNCGTLLVDWDNDQLYLVEHVDTSTPRIHRFNTPLDLAWTATSPTQLTQMTAPGTFEPSITGGDTSADGRRLILRSFDEAREYALPAGAGFNIIFSQPGTAVTVPGGQQYEAICYSDDGSKLFTTTELAGQGSAPIQFAQAAADNGYTTISGTPGNSGTSTFVVRVMDSAGNTAYAQLSITIG